MRSLIVAAGLSLLFGTGCVVRHDYTPYRPYVEYRYYGSHPLHHHGDAWCLLGEVHVHDYAPDYSVYVHRGDYYVYSGPVVVWFDGWHPDPHGGACHLHGRHTHSYHPPSHHASAFDWDTGRRGYVYRKPPPGVAAGHGTPPGHAVPPGQARKAGGPSHQEPPGHAYGRGGVRPSEPGRGIPWSDDDRGNGRGQGRQGAQEHGRGGDHRGATPHGEPAWSDPWSGRGQSDRASPTHGEPPRAEERPGRGPFGAPGRPASDHRAQEREPPAELRERHAPQVPYKVDLPHPAGPQPGHRTEGQRTEPSRPAERPRFDRPEPRPAQGNGQQPPSNVSAPQVQPTPQPGAKAAPAKGVPAGGSSRRGGKPDRAER
jgi:hypothetical protein